MVSAVGGALYGYDTGIISGVLLQITDDFEAASFAGLTLESTKSADTQHPAIQPMLYEGIEYLGIPAFQNTGTAVGYQMNDAFTGDLTAKRALGNSQRATGRVTKLTDKIEDIQSSD